MLPTPPPSPQLQDPSCTDPRIGLVIADTIELTGVLGVGAYGTVYQAQDIITGHYYAVKALNKTGLDARQRKFQKREVELHYHASQHGNVLSMYEIIDSVDCTFVVLEYCEEGDLFAKITEEGHYVGDDAKARRVFLQLLKAVQFCHGNNIYHRDLKPENILVKQNGSIVKLADFGLATRDSVSNDFGCGSTFYMSPECQDSNPRPYSCYRSAPNDVWSLGVILVNLTCGRNPWKRASMEDSTFRAFMKDPNFLKSILPISDQLNLILQRIFEMDPRKRMTVAELISVMERNPPLTHGPDEPITPPYSPRDSVIAADSPVINADAEPWVDSPMLPYSAPCDGGVEQVPVLHLPSPRFPTFQAGHCQAAGHSLANQPQLPPTPPGSIPGSPNHPLYTSQARSQVPYTPGPLVNHQPYDGWTTCGVYSAQPFIYPQYMPAWPSVY